MVTEDHETFDDDEFDTPSYLRKDNSNHTPM